MKIYIVKYTCSRGIIEAEAQSNDYSFVTVKGNSLSGIFDANYFPADYAITLEEAKAKALDLIRRKRASIDKQLLKLAKIKTGILEMEDHDAKKER